MRRVLPALQSVALVREVAVSVLSAAEIFRAALAAGFPPDRAVTWTAIALAESGAGPTPTSATAGTPTGCGRSTWRQASVPTHGETSATR